MNKLEEKMAQFGFEPYYNHPFVQKASKLTK